VANRIGGAPAAPSARAHDSADVSLLQACVDPLLAPERLRVAKAYLDCKARHGALADRVK
jgi:hypothetical protein